VHVHGQPTEGSARFSETSFAFGDEEPQRRAASAELRMKVRGFWALNARTQIDGKRNAMDAQSAEPFLVLAANPRVFLHARTLPAKPRNHEVQVRATVSALIPGVPGLNGCIRPFRRHKDKSGGWRRTTSVLRFTFLFIPPDSRSIDASSHLTTRRDGSVLVTIWYDASGKSTRSFSGILVKKTARATLPPPPSWNKIGWQGGLFSPLSSIVAPFTTPFKPILMQIPAAIASNLLTKSLVTRYTQ